MQEAVRPAFLLHGICATSINSIRHSPMMRDNARRCPFSSHLPIRNFLTLVVTYSSGVRFCIHLDCFLSASKRSCPSDGMKSLRMMLSHGVVDLANSALSLSSRPEYQSSETSFAQGRSMLDLGGKKSYSLLIVSGTQSEIK